APGRCRAGRPHCSRACQYARTSSSPDPPGAPPTRPGHRPRSRSSRGGPPPPGTNATLPASPPASRALIVLSFRGDRRLPRRTHTTIGPPPARLPQAGLDGVSPRRARCQSRERMLTTQRARLLAVAFSLLFPLVSPAGRASAEGQNILILHAFEA